MTWLRLKLKLNLEMKVSKSEFVARVGRSEYFSILGADVLVARLDSDIMGNVKVSYSREFIERVLESAGYRAEPILTLLDRAAEG